jgi:hypothetical protein
MTYVPQFNGPIEGWTVNYCRLNFWRVNGSMEWADVMQEAYLVFLRCASKYPALETPQHFMALYKMAWYHEFTDLAHKDTRLRLMVSETTMTQDGEEINYEPIGDLNHDGSLATLLRQAPQEVLMVLNLFLNAPSEILQLALDGWKSRDRRSRTGGSKRICQMLGLPLDLDVLQMVEDHFQPH